MTGVVEVKTERQVEQTQRDDIVEMHDKNTEHANGEVITTIKTTTSHEDKAEKDSDKTLSNGTSNGLSSSSESLEKADSQENVMKDENGEKDEGSVEIAPGMVVIQDTGFVVSIESPGLDVFDLAVSSMELVQEIFQVLIDKEDTCHRTCFTLQLDGITMDNFAELKNIEGLNEGSIIKVVEEPYTVREARIHVRHVRDLLKSVDNQDAYNGVDCNSLSFLNVITGGDILDKKTSRPESVDCTPPDYIMPCSKDRPITPMHPKELKPQPCLKVLTYSGWNPPPGNRKMHGDLLYLYVVTLEDKRYHLTASTRGFYVNQSTQDEFNPRPAAQKHLCHSLIDVLSQAGGRTKTTVTVETLAKECDDRIRTILQKGPYSIATDANTDVESIKLFPLVISPAFKRNFQILLKKRAEKHPFERVATPYQVYSWMVPNMDHCVDSIRAEDAFSSRLGYEEHIPGQTRDWNEELQTTRELPQKNLPERLIRERAIFKVHSDFVVAATRGAMAVIDGNIMAINPGEDSKMQMFLWNNIFFSLGFDIKDHYKDFGGDAAAYTAPGIDLQGVKAYSAVDPDGLYTLGTVVVDYRGYRVTAQSIIPGILEREQEQSVVYGSVDFGKTVVTCDKYKDLLGKTTQPLKIRPHTVVNEKGEEIELYSSVECKGIIGNDGRHYILDLLRTFPPDINYLPDSGEELSEEMKKLGYPRSQQHLLVCLRKELVDAFVENRYISFVRQAALLFQQWRLQKLQEQKETAKNEETDDKKEIEGVTDKKTEEGKSEEGKAKETEAKTGDKEDTKVINSVEDLEEDEAKKIVESFTKDTGSGTFEENSRTIMKKAARAVDSLSDTEFNISFNPDLFQPHVAHAQTESENHTREKLLVKSAAEFLVLQQIPSFIQDCLEHVSSPIDGFTLVQALHHNGINMRYLGNVTEMIESHETLSYLRTICVSELMCRATKHLFKSYTQGVEMMGMSAAIAHFLNCLLGSFPTPHTQFAAEELQSQRSRKRSRRKNKGALLVRNDNLDWASEQPKTLWRKIAEEVSEYYGYTLSGESIDAMFELYDIQKVSLLRRFCQMVGIQILLREYNLDSKTKQTFYEEDIVNVFPIVKNIHPKATDAYHVFTSGQNKIQQGLLSEGFDLISEALNLLNNVYGAMHPEITACARLLARLNYIMGDYPEALVFQQRAVLMSERVHGIDHPNTITEYAHLALYCLANNQVSTSLKLMYRARYLALVCHGENHPEVGLFDSNIGLILHAVSEFDLSLRFFQKSLELNTKFFGETSLKVAMSYHLIARTYSCKGDFRTALQNEKEAYTIYKHVLGETHERTRESTECLKHLTQQAVKFQKTMNQISKGERISNMPPLQIHTPSLANVLDTLNLINGIVFVHISQEDIEKFRLEMVQRQQAADKSITDCCGDHDHDHEHKSPESPSDISPQNGDNAEEEKETVLDTNENVTKDADLSDEASR